MKQLKQLLLVMAIALTGFTPAQAQTTTFNHYSEWMAYARRNMVYTKKTPPYSDQDKYDGTHEVDWWRYDDGLMYESILDTYEYYKTRGGVHGSELLSGVQRYLNKSITGSSSSPSITNFAGGELDDMRPGRLVWKYCYTYDHSEDSKIDVYKAACAKVINANAFQDDFRVGYSDGHKDFPWQHKDNYTQQVWLDGIFMGIPYWTLAGPQIGSSQKKDWGTNATKFFDDAVRQMQVTDSTTFVPTTRLWCHAWDYTKTKTWADCSNLSLNYPHITAETTSGNNTGRSLHTWGRALGWYAMAIMETMDNITAVDANYAKLNDMKVLFKKVMDAVISYRDETSGVWYCVLDVGDNTSASSPYNPDNYPVDEKPERNNYLEATCSSMFAYCLLHGVAKGYLNNSYLETAKDAYKKVVNNFITTSGDEIHLNNCMQVGGLDSSRDGSFAYYMSEPVIQDDSKGVGPFIWASLEAEKIGYNMETKSFDPIDENTIVTFAWSKASDEITQGASYTSPTFTARSYGNDTPLTNSSEIDFESSDPLVATVAADGTVTPVGIGTATITASLKEGSTYIWSGTNPSYTITVNMPSAELAYATTSITKEIGDNAFTNTLTNPNNVTVSYSITNNGTGSTINTSTGEVSIGSNAGTETITASFAGNSIYGAQDVTYTLTVSAAFPTFPQGTTVNFTRSGSSNQNVPKETIIGSYVEMCSTNNSTNSSTELQDGCLKLNTNNDYLHIKVSENSKITINAKVGTAGEKMYVGTDATSSTANTSVTTSYADYDFTSTDGGDYYIKRVGTSLYIKYIKVESTEVTAQVATPSISGNTSFTESTTATITCETDGATIHYTTDGSTPTASSATYSSPIAISATTIVKAIAVKEGMTDSDVASATFTKSGGGGETTSATITIGNSDSKSYAATFTSSSTNEHITASATSFTKGSTMGSGNSTYDSATAPYSIKYKPSSKINTSEYSDDYSVSAQFTIANGYTFTPTTISTTIVTEAANYTYQAVLTDGTTTYTSNDISSSSNGVSTFVFPGLSGNALSGTVTYKIRFKSTANNSKFFVINLPITISGTVSSSSTPSTPTYTVTATSNNNSWGTVSVDKNTATEGATVTITTSPAEGYELTSLTAKDASNNDVTITNNQFNMPASDVTVNATFAALPPVLGAVTFSPAGGNYSSEQNVTISATNAEEIWYSTVSQEAAVKNGANATQYTSAIHIGEGTTTLYATAYLGESTTTGNATYNVTIPDVGTGTELYTFSMSGSSINFANGDSDNFSITNNKSCQIESPNKIKFRWHASNNEYGQFTLTSKNNIPIQSVRLVATIEGDDKSSWGETETVHQNVAVTNGTYDPETMTWTANSDNVTSVTFTNNYDATYNGNIYISKIIVEYYAAMRTTTATIKAGKQYATFNTTMDIDFAETDGLQAFVVDNATKSSVHLTEVTVVPANTALIIKGAPNTYTLYETKKATESVSDNQLIISNSTVAADNMYYALGTVNGVQGFHRVQNGLTIPTSYVIITDQTAKSFLNFEEEENIATGIDGFATDNGFIVIDDNTPLYNLSGQRVSKDYKGIVIVNGKKVLRK